MNHDSGPSAAQARRGGGNRRVVLVAALLLVLVLLLTAFLVGRLAVRRYEEYLGGLWAGDPGFLQQAQLRDFQLFLAPREGGCRQGYLLMTDLEGRFVANQAFELREGAATRRLWTALRSTFRAGSDVCVSRAEFDYDAPASAPMPTQMKMAVSLVDGTLTLFNDEKVYAFLTKDLVASAAAVAAYAAP